jgi:hypothetical protein
MRKKTYAVLALAISAALIIFAAGYRPSISNAQTPPLTYGTLDNFDVINDTGVETHGFEIELEGISAADVAYTFGAPYQRYGDPEIDSNTVPGSVIIRYKATYQSGTGWVSSVPGAPGGTPIAVAPYLPTQGHSCWTGGVSNPAEYYTAGCDHFGASLNATPVKTTYRWLVEGSTPGSLVRFGTNAPLPAPVWNVVPAATPGAQPVAEVAVAAPALEPGQMWGEPMWVKVYVTELPNAVHAEDLEHMVIDDPNVNIVPNEPAEIEWEWILLQAGPGGNGEHIFGNAAEVGAGNESVSRRFEFYKYTGYLDPDPENPGEAMCDNPLAPDQQIPTRCGTPNADGVAGVGDLIGAQNAAVNLLGPVEIIPENHAPVAMPDALSTDEDTPLTVFPAAVLANDSDRDVLDTLNVHSVQSPVGGSVSWNGTNIVFTPDTNFNGQASFAYTISDGYLIATSTVTVTVNAVNDPPVANAGADQSARTSAIVGLDGTASSDIDGNSLTYAWSFVTVPAKSKAALTGSATANPNFKADKAGTYVVQLIVNDGTVDSPADTVTITVTKGKK